MTYPDLLFVPYQDTLDLLTVEDAMRVCEEVYHMLDRGTVVHSKPPSFKLDVAEGFDNHWHVKAALLKEIPTTGVRMYNYFDDGVRNTVVEIIIHPHAGRRDFLQERGGIDTRVQMARYGAAARARPGRHRRH